jgi:hypothetical protein
MDALLGRGMAPPRICPTVSWYVFGLLDEQDPVVGAGRIIAAGATGERRSASLLLAGSCPVRIVREVV